MSRATRTATVAILLLTVVTIAVAGVGTAAPGSDNVSDGPDWNKTPEYLTQENLRQSIVVSLHDDGSATMDITLNYQEYTNNGDSLVPRDEYYFHAPNTPQFAALSQNTTDVMKQLAAIASERTGRNISATHESTTYDYERQNGVTIHFTFKWTNLAETRPDDSLVVTQPFAQQFNTLYDARVAETTFTYSDTFSVKTATPEPAGHTSDAITYNQQHPMDNLILVVAENESTATGTSRTTQTPTTATAARPGQNPAKTLGFVITLSTFLLLVYVQKRLT